MSAPPAADPARRPLDATDRERAKALALALGFDLAGVAPAEPPPHAERLLEWIARGHAGEMHWLARAANERMDPRARYPEARSLLAVGLVYDPGPPPSRDGARALVSRYAGGEDYHAVLRERLIALGHGLAAVLERPVGFRACVDTAPLLERPIAASAGLGWIGKNTLLVHPRLGSWLFLGTLVLDVALPPDAPMADHCGSCTACLDACPTAAFPEPRVLDASRCLSYTTIELRGPVPAALRDAQGAWVFGCDVCQEVCPWNRRTKRRVPGDPHGLRARLAPRPQWRAPSLDWLLQLDEEAWRAATRHTALRRAKHRFLLRNAIIAAGHAGDASLAPHLRRFADGADPLLAEHARLALERLAPVSAGDDRAARACAPGSR